MRQLLVHPHIRYSYMDRIAPRGGAAYTLRAHRQDLDLLAINLSSRLHLLRTEFLLIRDDYATALLEP